MRRFVIPLIGVSLLIIVLFFVGFYNQAQKPIPPGTTGPEAEELAQKVFDGANWNAWQKIDAVEFTFTNMGSRHFRDRKRGLVEIQYAQGSDDYRVIYNSGTKEFLAWRNKKRIQGQEAVQAYQIGESYHRHDYFWLYPVETIKTGRVEFKKVGEQALLVHFPLENGEQGDHYLLIVDDNYRLTHWKIWSSGLPFQGVEVSFENWMELEGGILLSTQHETFLQQIQFQDVRVYPEYPLPDGEDRFQVFLESTDKNTIP